MAQEKTGGAELSGPARNPTEADRRILFPQTMETLAKGPNEAVYIVLTVNMVLNARKVPSHIRLQQLAYNTNGNLNILPAIMVTSSI